MSVIQQFRQQARAFGERMGEASSHYMADADAALDGFIASAA